MVDFHTHILPGMDDGSKDVQQSLQMLRLEQEMGIDTVVLTPHFYASRNNPARFLERRAAAWEKLRPALPEGCPELLLGAEVQYFDHMDHAEGISSLCIGSTGVLLLEMPFRPWDSRVLDTVMELHGCGGIQVVLAHIERYFSFCRKAEDWEMLRRCGILMQVNASFFSGFFGRRKAMAMMNRGEFQLIGSDCHNLDKRRPNWNLVPRQAMQSSGEFAKSLLADSRLAE